MKEDSTVKRLMKLRADPGIRAMNKSGITDVMNKDGKVLYSYDFFTEEQTTTTAATYGYKYGLLIIPTARSITRDRNTVNASVEVSAISADDPDDTFSVTGYGSDDGDRADGKALTYAGRRATCIILGLGSSESEPERKQTAREQARDLIKKTEGKVEISAPEMRPTKPIQTPKQAVLTPSSVPTPKTPLTVPVVSKVPQPTKEQKIDIAERKAVLRNHAVMLFADSRIDESQAREIDTLLRGITEEKEGEITQFIIGCDIDHEVV